MSASVPAMRLKGRVKRDKGAGQPLMSLFFDNTKRLRAVVFSI